MSIKDIVKDNKVRFMFYCKGELWYEVIVPAVHGFAEDTLEKSVFQFPVPIEDCGDGQFNAEDKAIMFMRYIRKYKEDSEALGEWNKAL